MKLTMLPGTMQGWQKTGQYAQGGERDFNMGLELEVVDDKGDVKGTHAASAKGLRVVADWFDSIPGAAGKYPHLSLLIENGNVADTAKLVLDVEKALAANPPANNSVKLTLTNLLQFVGIGDSSETARIVGVS